METPPVLLQGAALMKAIGLDIGTTSLSGVCCDTDTGRVVRSVTRTHGAFLPGTKAFEKIQDVSVLLDGLTEVTSELAAGFRDLSSIGLTGQMHGIVYTDAGGRPVSGLITWQDGRGDLPYGKSSTYASHLSRITGYPLATGYGAVTHFYNTLHGLVPPEAVSFCTIHGLAAMRMAGESRPLVHLSDAASFGLFDLEQQAFDEQAIARAGMDAAFFPRVERNLIPLGATREGIPVAVAVGDNQASFIGSAADVQSTVLINIGTGSQISAAVPLHTGSRSEELRPLSQETGLLVGSSLCGGRAYAILERFLRETAQVITGVPVKSAYPAMDSLMADMSAPQNPLRVSTLFQGTRQNPSLRGCIDRIGTDNLTVRHLCYGVMQGMAEELYDMYQKMRLLLPQPPKRLVGSGNGIRSNPPLSRLLEDTFGLPLSIPVNREEAAFGAALCGMVAAGICSGLPEAGTLVRYRSE